MITHAAIVHAGVAYALPAPCRHHHVLWWYAAMAGEPMGDGAWQGFLDDRGRFRGRREALRHALGARQVTDLASVRAGVLFSEDVW